MNGDNTSFEVKVIKGACEAFDMFHPAGRKHSFATQPELEILLLKT